MSENGRYGAMNHTFSSSLGIGIGIIAIVASIAYVLVGGMGAGVTTPLKNEETSSHESKEAENKQNEPKREKKKITVYFGSQTGTAEGFARNIMDESHQHGSVRHLHLLHLKLSYSP